MRAQEKRTAEQVSVYLQSEDMRLDEAITMLGALNQELPVEQMLLTTLSTEAVHSDHPLHEHFLQAYRQNRENLTALIVQEQRAGRLKSSFDAGSIAREIIATLDGLRLQWLLDPEHVQIDDALQNYANRIKQELAAPEHDQEGRRRRPVISDT
ncbi:TetR family transcriptional regulator C-terminal domain-containing protein [Streptomyces sp. NPDC091215]|uniref:TetR family transcriptional regulator C-terminal domain-containing protein n=1 Tax=Streptomyces sp. NPDC091215 TaxID=3155192 RepID=UPI0034454C7D